MKKRIVVGILGILMSLSLLAGCGNKPSASGNEATVSEAEESEDVISENIAIETEVSSDCIAGMANPFVAVEDDDEFKDKLDIEIDSSVLSEVTDMSICDDSFAQIVFVTSGIDGDDVEWTLRATKDTSIVDELSGMNYDDASEPIVLADVVKDVEVNSSECNDGKIKLYSWGYDEAYYSLTAEGVLSQMEIAEVLDSVMTAIGAQTMNY